MPTHGKARDHTRTALTDRQPFSRSGFSMSAVAGTAPSLGRLPEKVAAQYRADEPKIVYTVMSYRTPIAWVLDDGTVTIPDVRYTPTTNSHQALCRYGLR